MTNTESMVPPITHIPSYAKIFHLGHRCVDGIFNDPVVVQEKVDGSQISFAKLQGRLHVRSKGATILEGYEVGTDEGKFDLDRGFGMFELGVQNVAKSFARLPEGWVFRGEFLNKPKHNTLVYNATPKNNIVLFDALDAEGREVTHVTLTAQAHELDFDVIPQLYEGTVSSLEQLLDLLDTESYLGGPKIEGFVVKNYERFTPFGDPMFAKYVSEAFKESHNKDWKGRNPNTNDTIANLVAMYRTDARWEKAIQHKRDAGGLKNEPADIGPLMKELYGDLVAECGDEIKEHLWKHFGPRVIRGVQGGFAEFYKEKLVAVAFEEAA